MQASDAPYKVLFQDRRLFEETVRLVAPRLADGLDFGAAASLDKEHLTALSRTRVQDKLRRVERKSGKLANGRRRYVLALLEFQSGHDADMAWRMRDYLHLVESGLRQSGTARAEGEVPGMLSVVVHNGERPWRAAAECAGPLTGDAEPAQVRMYATVDLQVLARGPDGAGRRLVPGGCLATLAELEPSPAEALPRLLLEAFRRHAGAGSWEFRRGLHLRVESLERDGLAAGLPPLADFERALAESGGERMTAMLDATLARWKEAEVAQGVERGLAQGIERGRAQGIERGLAQGRVALLGRMAGRRFGAGVAGRVTALLADETDLSRPDEAGEWLLECDTGEALLVRIGGRPPRG